MKSFEEIQIEKVDQSASPIKITKDQEQ